MPGPSRCSSDFPPHPALIAHRTAAKQARPASSRDGIRFERDRGQVPPGGAISGVLALQGGENLSEQLPKCRKRVPVHGIRVLVCRKRVPVHSIRVLVCRKRVPVHGIRLLVYRKRVLVCDKAVPLFSQKAQFSGHNIYFLKVQESEIRKTAVFRLSGGFAHWPQFWGGLAVSVALVFVAFAFAYEGRGSATEQSLSRLSGK